MSKELMRLIKSIVKPVSDRVKLSIARGIIKVIDDSKKIQTAKTSLLSGEIQEKIERFQEFGFTSNPPADSEAAIIFVGGNREHGLIVGTEHRESRKVDLEPGEIALYNKDTETFMHFKIGGTIILNNSQNEFFDLVSKHNQAIIDARTQTLFGPQPLLSQPPNETFPQIKARFDTFKD